MFSAFFSFIAAHILYLALHLETGSFPRPMSAKQEQDAFRRFSQGDRKARDEIVCRNLRLVAHIAKKYYSATEDQDDLVSIGTIGLIKAVDSFNAQKGARFATYAARCIENELLMHFRSAKKTPEALSLSDPIEDVYKRQVHIPATGETQNHLPKTTVPPEARNEAVPRLCCKKCR